MADHDKQTKRGLPQRLVLASGNANKIREFTHLLAGICEVQAQADFFAGQAHEHGLSFVENALTKARFAAERSGLPAIGDDSGLMVAALHGAPGIYSGRYAGEQASDHENVQKLLYVLRGVPREKRQARYFCAMAYIRHAYDPTPEFAVAEMHGEILECPQGDAGYGFDAIFYLPETGCSVAELSEQQRLENGNRAVALKRLLGQLQG
jgi:XTP/dITP diphosphohydrolase